MHSAAGNNTRKTRTTTLIRTGAVVLMAAVDLSSAATTSATSYASYVCSDWIAKCREDAVCFACWQAPSTSQSLDCEDRYPGALAGTSCEATGATNCCDFTDSESAEECLLNPTMAGYWECVMADEGCLLEDMPCYSGGVLSTVDSAADRYSNSTESAATDGAELDTNVDGSSGTGVTNLPTPRMLVLVAGILCSAAGIALAYKKYSSGIGRRSLYTQFE